jgi:hypothetical protein
MPAVLSRHLSLVRYARSRPVPGYYQPRLAALELVARIVLSNVATGASGLSLGEITRDLTRRIKNDSIPDWQFVLQQVLPLRRREIVFENRS